MVEKKNSGKYLELMDFYDLLISGGSIQELADYMQEWLNNPVAVCNRNYDPIAIAGKGSEDAEIQDSNWTAFISCALVWKDRFVGDILVLEYDQKFTERSVGVRKNDRCHCLCHNIPYGSEQHSGIRRGGAFE